MDFEPSLRYHATLEGGVDRRDFMKVCSVAAAAVGLPASAAIQFADAAAAGLRPSVVWLHFQECTGCTESLLRTSAPDVATLILELISLDFHETLAAAAGHQFEAALEEVMEKAAGKFVLVVEGAIPTKDNGIYCTIAGRTAVDTLNAVAAKAGAIISIGSCASWGGVPSADPNPTGATGAPKVLEGKHTVVALPGCPANPYILLGTVLQYAVLGTLPALDDKNRPMFAYKRVIHEDCPRRAHFDAGRFAQVYGDQGHRDGYCLYKLGCKGPATHANCSLLHFGEVMGAWPIGVGHPCIGCTEKGIVFNMPIHQTVEIVRPTPPDTFPPIAAEQGRVSAIAAGVAGLAGGALLGAGWVASKKLGEIDEKKPSSRDKEA
ncbi:MAG: hydrogenase small subunit [Acidobacteria bacterium]|jgi:hydrogenase small subunit|nr:hydrogenase small subunit [Acidobacteriota bacterium]